MCRCYEQIGFCQRFVDLTGPLQLGGLPSLPTRFPVSSRHFSGCIGDVYIDHRLLDLNKSVPAAAKGGLPRRGPASGDGWKGVWLWWRTVLTCVFISSVVGSVVLLE